MYLKRLIFVSLLLLLPGAQFTIFASQAYAYCCMCGGSCSRACTCPGSHPSCPGCAAPNFDPETIKSFTSSTGDPSGTVNIRRISSPVLSSDTEDMIFDIRRSNGRENLIRKLVDLDSMKYARKFSCPQAEHENFQGKGFGFQAKIDVGN